MTIPGIIFGLVVALLAGALFHAVRGGSGWRLLLHFGLGILGFAIGQGVAYFFGFTLLLLGTIDMGLGIAGSVLVLLLGDWLSRIKPANKSGV